MSEKSKLASSKAEHFLSRLKHTYNRKLTESSINKDPFKQFALWFSEASKSGFIDHTAMSLATASKEGKPSTRMVLLKKFDKNGFDFFTNYESHKGNDLKENPLACLLFYWDKLERQVRIEGRVEKVDKTESEEYFATRSIKSQLGAWASPQSRVIDSRSFIVKEVVKYFMKFGSKNIPLPPHWGGYRLIPEVFEFWQGRPNRLHDRIEYIKRKDVWEIKRLAP
jgi:pyridoxamine 5'-phosphate oxidase